MIDYRLLFYSQLSRNIHSSNIQRNPYVKWDNFELKDDEKNQMLKKSEFYLNFN